MPGSGRSEPQALVAPLFRYRLKRGYMVQLRSPHGLEDHGIEDPERVYWNLTVPALYEEAVRRHEGLIAEQGPIVFHTGRHTGRSPKDKFLVRERSSANDVWWGPINQP